MMTFWPAIRVSLIFFCIIIASCKSPSLEEESVLKAYGGKEYKFAELPGYFASLVMETDNLSHREICSAAHIGHGFIITAAHCIDYDYLELVCRSGMWDSHGIDGFGIKHIRRLWKRLYDGQSSPQIGRFGIKYISQDGVMTMGFKDIESIVYHRGVYPDEQYQPTRDLVVHANDIALIKTHPPKPFAKAARLPFSSEERFSLQRIEGRLFFHGIGKHEDLKSDDSYFGGTIKVDRPSYRVSHGTSDAKSPTNSLDVSSSRDSLTVNPKSEEPLSCWQHFTYPGDRPAVSRREAIRSQAKNTIRVIADHSGRNGLKKVCSGDSGGPYVYSSEEEDILVGVHSSHSRYSKRKGCSAYGYMVSTFYHLSWLEKAKKSMTIGRNHSTAKLINNGY